MTDTIAVIGAGISGLVAAYVLSQKHNVVVFEQRSRAGGHANTTLIEDGGRLLPIDTGFIVFNTTNYPLLCRLFEMLDVKSQNSNMSFSVHCEKSGFEYNGSNLNTILSQRKNAIQPGLWKMLLDIIRFNNDVRNQLANNLSDNVAVEDFLHSNHYDGWFVERYLLPLCASIWSCDPAEVLRFPMRFVIEFLNNHALLQLHKRPTWRTVTGGSRNYVQRLHHRLGQNLRLGATVHEIRRLSRSVKVIWNDGLHDDFDEVVMATHADTSLKLVANLDDEEIEILQHFPYQESEATLHTDIRVLPQNKRTWASWNYRIPYDNTQKPTVTYNMNLLQTLDTPHTYCVSLNPNSSLDPKKIVRSILYRHPRFIPGRKNAQARHCSMIRRGGISYCGAYWGYGFHEDGIKSALSICDAFDIEAPF